MAGEDPNHLARVRGLRCCARELGPCSGGVQAHHVRDHTGLALRAHDHDAIPLCDAHHDALHDGGPRSPFRGWPRERLQLWARAAIAETLAYADRFPEWF